MGGKCDNLNPMDEVILEILNEMRVRSDVDPRTLDRIMRRANKRHHNPDRAIAKRRLLPFYLHERATNSQTYKEWHVSEGEHDALLRLLQAKPRRSASGVATVTVLTKPWPCGGGCIYCPNDVLMPKSYMASEPACQRALLCGFDPYLQVINRLRVLHDMGHSTDKVELIVLGGTFSDYEEGYRVWFMHELFRALNDFDKDGSVMIQAKQTGPTREQTGLRASEVQARINLREITYNDAVGKLYADDDPKQQTASYGDLDSEHRRNVHADSRCVGLVVETRPELITRPHLRHLRILGCTKIQIGIQSLRDDVLRQNGRCATRADIERAFALLREFGFKSHVHYMLNLKGMTPEADFEDYRYLMGDPRLRPDEVKLYPCALVESASLMDEWRLGEWSPYSEEDLVETLAKCVLQTPPYTRISRMIRDIPSPDIVVGNKKTNLRQLVEQKVAQMAEQDNLEVQEMRIREIATSDIDTGSLRLETVKYETSNTDELFLQFVDESNRLAAFLRLSLPWDVDVPAMIREVHVYGDAAPIKGVGRAQHIGLGRSLIEKACELAKDQGRRDIKVISAVGTRDYYSKLGFEDGDLYQVKSLEPGV